MAKKITIIIPTYNEKNNISPLIKQIAALNLPNYQIIVVDDNSPDQTAKIVENLSNDYPIKLIKRSKKEGLGRAYIHAFTELLNSQNLPDKVIHLDADFSHSPAAIPELIKASEKYDVVIGSRYAPGGQIKNWNLTRKIISRLGNAYIHFMLKIPIKDMTSGFICWDINTLRSLVLPNLSAVGYTFLSEIKFHAWKNGATFCEIPITFTERRVGASKFNLEIILESFYNIIKLKLKL